MLSVGRHLLLACLASTLLAAACRADPVDAGPALDLADYSLTFEDNFDTLDVSPLGPGTRWIAHTPWNGDFGEAAFTDPRPGFPFTIEDGILRIEARKDETGRWRSGLLASADKSFDGFMQRYGYFEVSAKLPPGKGVWPAFWLAGRSDKITAEIDIIEYYGQFPGAYMISVHRWDHENRSKSTSNQHKVSVGDASMTRAFHTYGVDINEDVMTFYFDRRPVWSHPTGDVHKRPLAILVNLALGGGWPIRETPDPSYMYVDYVRVWQRNSRLGDQAHPASDAIPE